MVKSVGVGSHESDSLSDSIISYNVQMDYTSIIILATSWLLLISLFHLFPLKFDAPLNHVHISISRTILSIHILHAFVGRNHTHLNIVLWLLSLPLKHRGFCLYRLHPEVRLLCEQPT